ncbi:alpha/beta hydrolase [Paeniglutamicibacter sp. ABSL32-1]|uniref:alpha/beta hydrolase family protein n=1 Tax=Paeniglutamicibacter quisquiliarum TaxID=2849498 RepID=UPI001C2D4E78|nr:alpha/beta hydrolase [Paeniglutamicibacter quisquiliarum]MBV1781160.1 alpha/beta hydrolase [Paeniglutamicibacter quisquiliarum]
MADAAGPVRFDYGEHPSQYAELWVPGTRLHEVVAVIVHGGFWRQSYGAELGRPLAADLAARGIVAWNLEYRRTAGGDGGYPGTFLDVAAGIDALDAALSGSGLHDGPRIGIGHSAGGHLALWAAGRSRLPAGAPGALPEGGRALDGVVSQAGVLDLHLAHELGLSGDAAGELMGCSPESGPGAWRIADPAARPLPEAPLVMLHGRADADVPVDLARSFAARALEAGSHVDYREFDGDHYGLITPGDPAWEATVAALLELGGGAARGGHLHTLPADRLPTGILKSSPPEKR